MARVLNRAWMTVSGTPDTGTVTLGSALPGYQTIAGAGGLDGDLLSLAFVDGNNFEFGFYTYTASGTTLARTKILASSNSGSAVSLTANATVFSCPLASDIPGTAGGFVNKFRNGTMDVSQRGTAAITITTAGAYALDGWIVTPTGASVTAQQTTSIATVAPCINSMLITGATSVTGLTVKQRIESSVAAPLAGKIVTVQAVIFNSTGGSITPTLTVKHPTLGVDNYSGSLATDVSAVSFQACPNGVATTVAYTFVANAAAYFGLEVTFDFGNNFSTTGKQLCITALDIRATPHAITGLNSAPPTPELRAIETAFSQRYLWCFNPAANPIFLSSAGMCYSTTQFFFILPFPQPMYKVPTLTVSAAGDFFVLNASAATIAVTALTLAATSIYSAEVTGTVASGLVAGNTTAILTANTSAKLTFSAEL